MRFDFLSFQLLEPETESESDPESYLVMKGSIGSGSSSDDGGSSGGAGGATAAMAPPPRWPPLPPYTLRGLRSEWDCDVSTQNMNAAPGTGTDGIDAATEPRDNITPGSAVDEDFLRRRRQVLRWVTSVGFDIHNMPINEANLIETLRAAHPPPDKESFSPSSSSPSSSSSLSAVVSSVRLYGALQSLFKMHPLFDLAIAEILCRDASAIVLLSRNGRQRHWEQTFRVRLASTLRSYNKHSGEGFCNKTHHAASCGGSCAGSSSKVSEDSLLSRVLFVNQMQHAQYQTLLCSLDVTLDTFPFGGGVTLSDALGGCGLNALSAVFQNDLRDIYHYVVPFVTSGQLQSVHQIGAGMVDKLGANMSDFVHSTPTTLVPYENPSAPLNACLHNDTAVSCVGSTLTSQLQYMHLTHICEYATAAVILASQAQVRKMTVNDTKSRRNDVSLRLADISARTRINDILYDSGDAVKEWNVFLQNIVESDV